MRRAFGGLSHVAGNDQELAASGIMHKGCVEAPNASFAMRFPPLGHTSELRTTSVDQGQCPEVIVVCSRPMGRVQAADVRSMSWRRGSVSHNNHSRSLVHEPCAWQLPPNHRTPGHLGQSSLGRVPEAMPDTGEHRNACCFWRAADQSRQGPCSSDDTMMHKGASLRRPFSLARVSPCARFRCIAMPCRDEHASRVHQTVVSVM